MKENLKKIGLLLSFLVAIFFVTGCRISSGTPAEPTKYTVTAYAAENADAQTFTVEEGDTLSSISGLPTPVLNGYTFIGWFTSEKVKIELSSPIKGNLTIYAKFEKKSKVDDTTTTETKTTDGTSSVTVETTTTDVETGITTTVTETTTTDKDGNISTETGTDVKPGDKITVNDLINLGIGSLVSSDIPDIVKAQAYFNAACELDPESDKAKVYSALSDIASIITNPKIQKFFSDHVGITNYPSDLNTLISGNWLSAKDYVLEDNHNFYVYSFEETDSNVNSHYNYYKAKMLTPDSPDYSAADWDTLYYKVKIDGKDYYINDQYDKELLEKGKIRSLFGGDHSSIYGPIYSAYKLDENGDCFVYTTPSKANGAKPYKLVKGESISGTYKLIYKAPVLKPLIEEGWFTKQTSNALNVYYLLIANLLNGNSEGVDLVIDDLYSAIFESDEYISACKKIDSISDAVELPAIAVQGLGLDEIFGSEKVAIGATELKLIESVLNIYKGLFEYLQCYSFNMMDTSFIKDIWASVIDGNIAENKEKQEELMAYAMSLISSYNASIDPIANGFLSVRNADKMTASKNTFTGILTDLITAYASITGKDTIYPSAITQTVAMGEGIKDGVVLLKDAITKGEKFYIPKALFDGIPESWPTAASSDVYTLDCGKLFTAGQFAIDNLLDIGTVSGAASPNKVPYLYKVDEKGKLGDKITTANDFASLMVSEDSMIAIRVLAPKALAEVITLDFIPSDVIEIKIPAMSASMIFEFYYGGLAELMEAAQNGGN